MYINLSFIVLSLKIPVYANFILSRTYVCKVTGCEHQEPNRKAFETHVKTVHPNECWLCDLCGRNFSGEFDEWIDRKTGRQIGRQIDRQIDRWTYR